MDSITYHPNTETLISAWQRMTNDPDAGMASERASDHPDILECLFVIERSEEGRWLFRNAGNRLGKLLGRELSQHDCLDFWTGHDRIMLGALLETVRETRRPAIMRATGETLTGTHVALELTWAPLPTPRPEKENMRLLGLYQVLQPHAVLKGRPIWRHRITAIYPPKVDREPANLRLVASND